MKIKAFPSLAFLLGFSLAACHGKGNPESGLQSESEIPVVRPAPTAEEQDRGADYLFAVPGTLTRIDAALPVIGPQSGDAQAASDNYAHPKSDLSLCLSSADKSGSLGNAVAIDSCSYEANQQFRVSKQGYLTTLWNCVGFNKDNNAVLMDCTSPELPVLLFEGTMVRKKDSPDCLAVSETPAVAGSQLTLRACSASDPAQQWSFGKKSFESLTKDIDPKILEANAERVPPPVDEVLDSDHNPFVPAPALYSAMPLDAQLFPTDGEWARYVSQSKYGDCSVLSVILSLASLAQDRLFNMIYKIGPRRYQVQLFWGGRRIGVNVDDKLPLSENGWEAAAPSVDARSGRLVLYVSLIEKALSLLREAKGASSGFDNLIDTQAKVMLEILGVDTTRTSRNQRTWTETHLEWMIQSGLLKGVVVAAILGPENSLGIPTGHAYSILGLDRNGSETLVRIRNPWGFDSWKASPQFALVSGNKNSTFTITLRDFVSTFTTLDIANLPD